MASSPFGDIDRSASHGTPIWLDCDTGHDDAFAILVAAHSPELRLLGISTVYGNAPLPHTTYNTRAILKAIGREDVPVFPGAERPSFRQPCFAPDIHGASGLDGTASLPIPTVDARRDMSAVEAMRTAISAEAPRTVCLVATGALTNIAALFESYPGMVDQIKSLSIMGGAVGGGFTDAPLGTVDDQERFGNWTPVAEFNVYIDCEAAATILNNRALAAKTNLVTLDLSHQFLATNEVRNGLLFGDTTSPRFEVSMSSASDVRRLFYEIVCFFAKTYAEVFGIGAGPPTHDPLAVFIAFSSICSTMKIRAALVPLGIAVLTSELDEDEQQPQYRYKVEVVTEGDHGSSPEILNGPSECGRTIVSGLAGGQQGVRIPKTLQVNELWARIDSCLRRAERTVAAQRLAATNSRQSTQRVLHESGGSKPDAAE
ncbi:uridine nucleosidase-like [Teratosphaeria destructans]|uniref:Uridine nucleosidase-like n=1 Tax=Teratosphaeria destructans TaxID=418781 RepID=A0A9W7SY55_9PEZI|nr:uridine nucleosidase-like [Teratosphaeria destructans]